MTTPMSERAAPLLLLAALLLALLPLRMAWPLGPGPYGVDASYYYQIARHVSEGEGLRTSVSVFHEGAPRLPTPTRIYPLWPTLLGLVGSAIGLHNAASILLFALYFLDLILVYFLANVLAERIIGPGGEIVLRRGPVIVTVGHLVSAVLGTNRKFFEALGDPYTEGLAFACAFASVLLLARERESRTTDALSGVAAACAVLARSQMAAFAAGVGAVLLYRALRSSEARRSVAAWTAGAVLPIVIWYAYLFVHFPPSALNPLRGISPFFKYTQVPIEPFVWWVPAGSATEWLADRLPGILVAFDPRSPFSFFSSFGAVAAAVPLALVVFLARAIARRGESGPIDPIVAATLAGGTASTLVLLHFHGWHFLPWLFGWRHGLPYIFLIAVSLAYLLKTASGVVRGLVLAMAALSVVTGAIHCLRDAAVAQKQVTDAERSFVRWTSTFDRTPTFLTTQAQLLGMMTRANYHWTHCRETSEQTRKMLQHLPIDYILVFRKDRPCTFMRGLNDVVEPHLRFESAGETIDVLRRRAPSAGDASIQGRSTPPQQDPRRPMDTSRPRDDLSFDGESLPFPKSERGDSGAERPAARPVLPGLGSSPGEPYTPERRALFADVPDAAATGR